MELGYLNKIGKNAKEQKHERLLDSNEVEIH
jgi:hypothetical protein